MKIPKFFSDLVLKNTDEQRLRLEAAARDTRGSNSNQLSGQLTVDAVTLQVQTMKKYKDAIALATDPEQPDRSALVELWRTMMLDNHLMSTIDTRILASQRSPYKIVNEKREENEELTWLFQRPWHAEFMYKVLFEQYKGTTLIELYDLNDEGELESITEIPQTHFNAKKGIITKEEGATDGWSYLDGVFSKYYLQIGKADHLGMFTDIAPVVLAKKLGLGSWMDYIEKYGVPPLWISTDREDQGRMRQLLQMGKNFKHAPVVVTRGNEKVEMGKEAGNTSAADNFDKLIERANSEMSKRILGGTGTSDEKSHVGAANVHFELAKDRMEADKLLYKHIFNAKLKPKLMGLSSVYAPLQNHYFEWDNTESFSKKDLAELYAKLGATYELDPEEISEQLGITILGQRGQNQEDPNQPNPQKKKAQLKALAELHASLQGFKTLEGFELEAIDLSAWEKVVNKIAKDLHEGNTSPEQLNPTAIRNTYSELNQAAKKGYGKDWADFSSPEPSNTVLALQKNLFRFSGAKTYAMQLEIQGKMYKDGKLRPYSEFEKDVLALNGTYNRNYLQAEYQTARQAAHHSRNWQKYQEDKDLFPNLKYKTAGDKRVRDDHARLSNIVKPVDDPFWDKYYPPNGWRCFEPDTLILTRTGWRKIKDIRPNEYLIGGSGEERVVGDVITNPFNGNLSTLFSKGESLSCTPNHRFLTTKGWLMAGNIQPGDIIVQVGKAGFFNKISNAIHNLATLIQHGFMSVKRKRKPVGTLEVNDQIIPR